MLQTIKLMKLRIKEFTQFFMDLITIIDRYGGEKLKVATQVKPVAENTKKLKEISDEERGSEISDELKQIDDNRDEDIIGIRTVVEGYTHHYDEKIKEAAELLLKSIDHFGPSIAKQNYPTETASLSGISKKFTTDKKCIEALSVIHLNDWFLKMDKENKFFNERYIDRTDENSKKLDEKAKELRKTVTEDYYTLRNHLNAYATIEEEAYSPVIKQINDLIVQYNDMVARRQGNKGDEEGDSDE